MPSVGHFVVVYRLSALVVDALPDFEVACSHGGRRSRIVGTDA
jgi:hypothetical protein